MNGNLFWPTGTCLRPVPSDAETPMPHVIIKMLEGRSEALKVELTDEIAKALKSVVGCGDESISVAIEDVAPADWKRTVYDTDILGAGDNLYKKPGYKP